LSAFTILFQLISVAGTAPAKCPISRVASAGATVVGPKSNNREAALPDITAKANEHTNAALRRVLRGNFIGC
jgi:hypothetical protein